MTATDLCVATDVTLPRDTVTSTVVVYGGKGMGKTVFGAVLAEELARAHLRWAWLDPLGVSYGLRHSADGKGPGVECLILGGPHGDIPIQPEGGAAVADVVVEESVNVLIDFSRKPSGEMWGVGEKIRFVTAYAKRLFQRQGDLANGKRREPLMQILDEAARYIPQMIPHSNPGLAECVGAWQQLVEEGRNIGLGVCLITQRSARMNKDVSELADAMLAFRTIGPNSLGAVLDWLGEHVERARVKELAEVVRKLDKGSALLVSPGWLNIEKVVHIRMRKTFDSSATPKPGQRVHAPKGGGAKPNIDKIRERMAAAIEWAKDEDPKLLRKRVLELEKQLAAKPAPLLPQPKAKTIEVSVLTDADRKLITRMGADFLKHDQRWLDLGMQWADLAKAIDKMRERVLKANTVSPSPPATPAPTGSLNGKPNAQLFIVPRQPKRVPAPRSGVSDGEQKLPRCERALLTALAQHGPLSLVEAAIITGYTVCGNTRNAAGALRGEGLVTGGNDRMEITDAGRAVPPIEELPTGSKLASRWYAQLAKCEREILQVVVQAYPNPVSLQEAADLSNYVMCGNTRNAAGKLRRLFLVQGKNDAMKAHERLVG